MIGDDLFNFANMMYALEDDGLSQGCSLEEANETYNDAFDDSDDFQKWDSQEQLDADWKKYHMLCELMERLDA